MDLIIASTGGSHKITASINLRVRASHAMALVVMFYDASCPGYRTFSLKTNRPRELAWNS